VCVYIYVRDTVVCGRFSLLSKNDEYKSFVASISMWIF